MKTLIAIAEIWRTGATSYATGELTPDGQPVFAREVEKVRTGTRFTVSDEEAADLIAVEAAVLDD